MIKRVHKHIVGLLLGAASVLFVSSFSSVMAREYLVKNQHDFRQAVKKLKPGDSLVMRNGIWADFEAVFQAKGTKDKPISLRAEGKGKVIFSGQSNLRLAGEYLLVSGLVFKNGFTPRSEVISFRRSKNELANYSRVTETVIDNFSNPERTETDYWVSLYGKHNRFDHNHIEGKRNRGVTLAVRLDSEESRENHHRIDHNYFGPRPILGSNGGETLRIGTSHYSLSNSFTLVENNYFDRCDGELEIISNKSGGNVFRGNTFFESRGTLTLRHGNGNLIEENSFIGNGVDHTGGIRVINKRQTIRNNYLEGLAGYRFGGALVVMNGVPNSPINRYHQVDAALIENNTLINSEHIQLAAGSDPERAAIPINSQFKNNLIYNENHKDIFTVYDDISGIEFVGNVLNEVKGFKVAKGFKISEGFKNQKVTLKRAKNGLMYPVDKSLVGIGIKRDIKLVTKKQTGVAWYPKSSSGLLFETGKTVNIKPGEDTLAEAIKLAGAGDTIRLQAGDYSISKTLIIDKPISIRARRSDREQDKVHLSFARKSLFELADGGSLHLHGLHVSGKKAPDDVGNSVIRSSRYSMLVNYQVKIEQCEFSDLDVNRAFNFLKVSKSTFADSIEISNSRFSNVSGAILKLDDEKDDYGIYNAEYVSISNSHFKSVQGALIDFYRGGTDESTFGPHFSLLNSTLENVGAGSRNKSGASVHLHGVQVVSIKENQFVDSRPIKVFHTVGEPVTRIIKNNFSATELPEVVELNSEKENTAWIRDNTSRANL